jgi:hypothetical protein
LGKGDGTFAERVDYPGGTRPLLLADLNGNGKPEIVVANGDSLSVLPVSCR